MQRMMCAMQMISANDDDDHSGSNEEKIEKFVEDKQTIVDYYPCLREVDRRSLKHNFFCYHL